jgi:hypothetical protein
LDERAPPTSGDDPYGVSARANIGTIGGGKDRLPANIVGVLPNWKRDRIHEELRGPESQTLVADTRGIRQYEAEAETLIYLHCRLALPGGFTPESDKEFIDGLHKACSLVETWIILVCYISN